MNIVENMHAYLIQYVIFVQTHQAIITEDVAHMDHATETVTYANARRKHLLEFVTIAENHHVTITDNAVQ